MIRLKIRCFLICTFLCAPFFSNAQRDLADSLYAKGNYWDASIAYEYAIYKSVSASDVNQLLLHKAYCLKHLGKFESAYQNLERANFYFGTDSVRASLFYEYAVNAILASRSDMALSKLMEMEYELKDTSLIKKILPLQIISLNNLGRWKEASVKYDQLLGTDKLIHNPYQEILNFKFKDIEKAETLSYWLPGVGQMYAGYFWKGVVSTLLNASTFAFGVLSVWNGYYFSGIFSGMALFYMSYNGGARYAGVLAKEFNETKSKAFQAKVLKDLIERQK